MRFARDIEEELTADELSTLEAAFDIVSDQLFDELTDLATMSFEPGRTLSRPFSDLYLPVRYRDQYDLRLLRRLLVCLICVAERVDEPLQPLRCRGEELALRAVIDMAISDWDTAGQTADHSFDVLFDLCYTDLDHEYMFNAAFDGIDDPDTEEGSQLGIRGLRPSTWFEPLVPGVPVHPLAAS